MAHLLRPVDDVLDHGAGVEVLEVQDLLVAVGVGDLEEAVLLGLGVHPLDGRAGSCLETAACASPPNSATSSGWNGNVVVRYLLKMSRADSASGRSILIFTSSRPGRRMAGSIMSSRLEAPMTSTFSSVSTPSISLSSCGTMVFSTSEDTPDPRVRNRESISSKKTMTGVPSRCLLARPLEDQADVALGLADVLVEQLGTLDVQEVATCPRRRSCAGDLLCERVGDGLGDERLAAARRAVEQDALRRLQLVLRQRAPDRGTAARRRRWIMLDLVARDRRWSS